MPCRSKVLKLHDPRLPRRLQEEIPDPDTEQLCTLYQGPAERRERAAVSAGVHDAGAVIKVMAAYKEAEPIIEKRGDLPAYRTGA